MSGVHARPSRPGRAVLALAALALPPPTVVLAPRLGAAQLPAPVPDVGPPDAAPEVGLQAQDDRQQDDRQIDRTERRPDRYGARPHLSRWSAP